MNAHMDSPWSSLSWNRLPLAVLESSVFWTERTLECLVRLRLSQRLSHSSNYMKQGSKHKLAIHKTHVLFLSAHV